MEAKQLKPSTALVAALIVLLVLGAAGCSSSTNTNSDVASSSDAVEAPPTPAPQAAPLTVPAGTALTVEFADTVSSETSRTGDSFSATVVDPVMVDGGVAIPGGATVQGSVVEANRADKIGGVARLTLEFSSLVLPSGEELPISADLVEQGEKQTKKDAATIGGATAGGAILGNIIGDKRGKEAAGTKIGAVIGAAVGTAIAATNKNDPVEIPSGTVLSLYLQTPVTVNSGS